MPGEEIRRTIRAGRQGEMEEELSFHLDEVIAELVASGMTCAEAEAEARRRFGDEAKYRAQIVRIDRVRATGDRVRVLGESVRAGARGAWRGLRQAPGLGIAIVLSFALGIGANAMMFGTIERLWLRAPDHVADADGVRRLHVDRASGAGGRMLGSTVTFPDFEDLRDSGVFDGLAGYTRRSTTIERGADARSVTAELATGNYWTVLGAAPALGRFYTSREDRLDGDAVVVLSWRLFRAAYGGDASVLGTTIELEHGRFTVIGIAPEGFTGVELTPADVWIPLRYGQHLALGDEWAVSREWWFVRPVARLGAGMPVERAEASATAVYRNSRRAFIESGDEGEDPRIVAASLIAARSPAATDETRLTRWLAIVSLTVLVIACMNVATLLLVRASRRQRETAVRLALGISRSRLLVELLTEGVVFAGLGGLAALAMARWGGLYMQRILLPDIAWGGPITLRLIGFTVAAALMAGLVAAILPALRSILPSAGAELRGTGSLVTMPGNRLRIGMTTAQATFSVLLLIGAGLFVRSLQRVRAADLGIDARDVVVVRPVAAATAGAGPDVMGLRDRIASLPGVRSTAVTRVVPFGGSWALDFAAEAADSLVATIDGPYVYPVTPEFFDVVGLDRIEGRLLADSDVPGAPRVAVINLSMAESLWPAGDAIGRCMYLEDAPGCTRVVGIVEDARRQAIREPRQPLYYIPIGQAPAEGPAARLLVRTDPRAAGVVETIRREVIGADPLVRYVEVTALQSLIDPETRAWKVGASIFSTFGALALLIAAIGLYSALAFDVTRRTREIGLRTALGATRPAIVGRIVGRGLGLVAAGILAGLSLAWLGVPRLAPMLFEIAPRDPATFLAVPLILAIAALLAAVIPSWRASRVDPNEALRSD